MRRRWVYRDGDMVEVGDRPLAEGHFVQNDISPYQSMIDGSTITSRSHHRDHLRQHDCIEVGNEQMSNRPVEIKDDRRERLTAQLDGLSNAQADKMLRRMRDNDRFTLNPHREK